MKYIIKDEEKEYEIEEITDEEEVEVETLDSLSEEDISVLLKLVPYADKIIAMCETTNDEDEVEVIEDEDEDVEVIEDEDIEKEEIIETRKTDSKRSYGSIEKKQKRIEDGLEEDCISDAWAKRYGGNN